MKIYKISIKQKSIQQIAKEVRAYFVKSYDDEYLKSVCLPVSRKLKEELIKYGYDAIVVQGTFKVDNPDPSASDEWDINDFENEEEMEDATYHPLHYWVEVENAIVDITASQFQDEVDDGYKIPNIIIGTYAEEPRYTVIARDWI